MANHEVTRAQAAPGYKDVNPDILATIYGAGKLYWGSVGFCVLLVLWGAFSWWYQVENGMWVYGATYPAMWGTYIVNFVFWVGIAHSGTLISAILFLLRAKFRRAIYRCAEAMTVFAVMTAGLFPVLHVGRPWFIYFALPYPNQRQLWVNFRSPLVWDVFAVSTYFTVSSIFLFTGLIPDIAVARDHAKPGLKKFVYTLLSLGWRGTDREWKNFNGAYLYLAAFATPLVLSVHSVVSWDFAMSLNPGWHSTIFAPYFVAGAIFSGVGMVVTIMVPLRKFLKLEQWVTLDHFDKMAKLCLFTSLIVGYAYFTEIFLVWYHGNAFEIEVFRNRFFGPMWITGWMMMACNVFIPLALFWKKVRTNLAALWIISLFVNVGMWLERFVIVVQSLSRPFLTQPQLQVYHPGIIEIGIFVGSFGWFFMWFLLFTRFLPIVAIAEIKEILPFPQEGRGARMKPQGVLGIFGDMDTACDAIRALRKSYAKLTVLSPAPHHELENALESGPSNVRWFTLCGALTGLGSAIALTTWTSADWPLVTGGKPIVISPGYFVIMFELTVLFSALFSVAGFIILSKLPHTRLRVGYDERFSDASIGIWLPVAHGGADAAAQALRQNGAEDVKIEAR